MNQRAVNTLNEYLRQPLDKPMNPLFVGRVRESIRELLAFVGLQEIEADEYAELKKALGKTDVPLSELLQAVKSKKPKKSKPTPEIALALSEDGHVQEINTAISA